MKFNLKINGSESENAGYVGWTPVKCTVSLDGYSGSSAVLVSISVGQLQDALGEISLYENNSTSATSIKSIEREYKGEDIVFYVAGKFGNASVAKQDTFIKVTSKLKDIDEIVRKVMVRVRKNANNLEQIEINKFLEAFIKLNSLPSKRTYTGNEFVKKPNSILHELVLMHTYDAASEIHNRTSFHPWHRAFLLHLERELQLVDPTVTIPYWKCDEKADNVFTTGFMGVNRKTELDPSEPDFDKRMNEKLCPKFDQTNPMYNYKDHTLWGPLRRAYFYEDPAKQGLPAPRMIGDYELVDSDEAPSDFMRWSRFEELWSHNRGHVTFTGHVVDVGKDPVDPLFFMLHSNVDRLWARWQKKFNRFDKNDEKTYPFQGAYKDRLGKNSRGAQWATGFKINEDGFYDPSDLDVGNWVDDTLWPWDQDHILSRPIREWNAKILVGGYGVDDVGGSGFAEGEKHKVPQIDIDFPTSLGSNYPEGSITVGSTIDYQGRTNYNNNMGFDYDKVPYFDNDEMPTSPPRNESVSETSGPLGFGSSNGPEITSPEFLDQALIGLLDQNVSLKTKSNLIHQVFASKRFSKFFPSRKPQFFNILRGMLQSNNPQFRFQAMDILSSHEDQEAQSMLVNSIELESNEESSIVSKRDALFFLRQSTKQQHTELLRKIIEKNTDTDDIRAAAIEGLANDPESIELIEKVVLDSKEPYKVRTAGALAMNFADNAKAVRLSAQVTVSEKSQGGIRAFQNDPPTPEEVDFTATLLNIMTYTTEDFSRLKADQDLSATLQEIIDPKTENKVNFITTLEMGTDSRGDGQTVIEQMAGELLSRIS